MGRFLKNEKPRQADFKATSDQFTGLARMNGMYRHSPYPYCLPVEHASQNLYLAFRQAAPEFFASRKIKWHDGQGGQPSNHLCDSQVCCVNFLFPFTHDPAALLELLRRIYPDAARAISFDGGAYLTFEWIGEQ